MAIILKNELGNIKIRKDVVSQIAGASAIECYGLVGMVSFGHTGDIVRLLKRDQLSKGVKIEETSDGIVITLGVVIQFATKISVVAENIISQVKYNVEKQAGVKVSRVNINIESVRVQN
ncbi:MAG: Asp23/Gls24 family envelope stress response protein [Bacillota bacterium]|nr:Asp23/Gls24 family envelope stress response protein [Bacillota bacterium]